MSAALHVILASQAAAEAARKSLFERFRVTDATHETRALTLNELGIERTSALDELVRKGVVREVRPGQYYLDEPAVAALGRAASARSNRALAYVAFIVLLVLVPILLMIMMGAT